MNILSLFDGMSCGRIALERSGIKIDKYYRSEIDKYANIIAEKNYPDSINLGDVQKWEEWNLNDIDMVIGGPPCQSYSFAGKQKGLDDPRGALIYHYFDILKHYQPKLFLIENVRGFITHNKGETFKLIMTELNKCGYAVDWVEINSNLVSAQNRQRVYVVGKRLDFCLRANTLNCTIRKGVVEIVKFNSGIKKPKDKGIMLKDIVLENTWTDAEKSYCIDANYHKGGNPKQYYEKKRRQQVFEIVKEYIVPFDKTLQILNKEVQRGKVGYYRKDSQANRVYYIHDKAVTLCGDAGGGAAKMGQYLFGCITPDRVNKRQNGQRFNTGDKFYTLTAQDKHGVLIEGYIRKLTPLECERLQTMPEGFTEGVSNSQRYKMLGNGWTVDVITHIFKGIKEAK